MSTICSERNLSAFDTHLDQTNTVKGRRVLPPAQMPGFGRRFLQWIERRREQRESRDAFSHLLKLDDSLLLDIGVTRADVERAANLPLTEDAAQVLHEATGRYRSNRV